MTLLVTGGAGFIGSNYILDWFRDCNDPIVNIDKLTYAGNVANLSSLDNNSKYVFEQLDICDSDALNAAIVTHKPGAILHFAAESHVDRSIHDPETFINTNVLGTFRLLDASLKFWQSLAPKKRQSFRFLHVSTDEVYGSLGPADSAFCETTAYAPNSPYSASKAASDHLVRAYHQTYGLPVITANCSNNYGPFQFPEKFIPLMILNGLSGNAIPIYGDGQNIRDWLYVGDHCAALRLILHEGVPGETYNIGGKNEITNIDVANSLCEILDELRPRASVLPHKTLIRFVDDRPGHDRRYAVDTSKIERELGWRPRESFETGLEKTVRWYLDNAVWLDNVSGKTYEDWVNKNYGQRVETL